MGFSKQFGMVAASLLLFCANGWADTISLPLTDDGYIHGLRPTGAYSTRADIFVTSYGPKQGLVRFDSASLAGLEINTATLNLYLSSVAAAGTISIYPITSSWSESNVTWDNQPPSEATATAVVSIATADVGSVISIDVTDVVKRWADGSLADGGFLIVTTNNIKAYFDAHEKTGGTPATLEVDTGPAPATGEAIVLDLSNSDNCIIDEPGFYILDRSWHWIYDVYGPPEAAPSACQTIYIRADVTLDMRGFSITVTGEDTGEDVVNVESGTFLARNGSLIGEYDAISVYGTNTGVILLENMHVFGAVSLKENSHVTNSFLHGGAYGVSVGSNSVVMNT